VVLKAAEEVGAKGRHRHEPAGARLQCAAEETEEGGGLGGGPEQLLGLVDHQEGGTLAAAGGLPELPAELGQGRGIATCHAGPEGGRIGIEPQPVAGRHQRLGEFVRRPLAGAEGLDQEPARGVAAQERQEAGAQQRGLAAARGTEQEEQPGTADPPQAGEGVHGGAGVVVAAEEDGGVGLLQRLEAGIGGPGGVVVPHGGRVEPGAAQPLPELDVPGLGIGDEVALLDVTQDRAGLAGAMRTGKTLLPRKRAWRSSKKHQGEASQAGLTSATTARQARSRW
jgi:hypothetical protein